MGGEIILESTSAEGTTLRFSSIFGRRDESDELAAERKQLVLSGV
jgi:hypothetical protein